MLFSAGTFLYVAAVHVLPELTMRRSHAGGAHSSRILRKSELLAIIVGALLPSVLTMGHHHQSDRTVSLSTLDRQLPNDVRLLCFGDSSEMTHRFIACPDRLVSKVILGISVSLVTVIVLTFLIPSEITSRTQLGLEC